MSKWVESRVTATEPFLGPTFPENSVHRAILAIDHDLMMIPIYFPKGGTSNHVSLASEWHLMQESVEAVLETTAFAGSKLK